MKITGRNLSLAATALVLSACLGAPRVESQRVATFYRAAEGQEEPQWLRIDPDLARRDELETLGLEVLTSPPDGRAGLSALDELVGLREVLQARLGRLPMPLSAVLATGIEPSAPVALATFESRPTMARFPFPVSGGRLYGAERTAFLRSMARQWARSTIRTVSRVPRPSGPSAAPRWIREGLAEWTCVHALNTLVGPEESAQLLRSHSSWVRRNAERDPAPLEPLAWEATELAQRLTELDQRGEEVHSNPREPGDLRDRAQAAAALALWLEVERTGGPKAPGEFLSRVAALAPADRTPETLTPILQDLALSPLSEWLGEVPADRVAQTLEEAAAGLGS